MMFGCTTVSYWKQYVAIVRVLLYMNEHAYELLTNRTKLLHSRVGKAHPEMMLRKCRRSCSANKMKQLSS